MKIIINEMASLGYELKQSRVINERSGLNCIDIFKNGEYVTYISPSIEKTVNTKDGQSWMIKDIFCEFYELTDVEFIEKRTLCTLDEYYAIKKELKSLGIIKSSLEGSDEKADAIIKESGESLSDYLEIAKLNNCWVAREYESECSDNYLYFISKPSLELFYKALEMVKKIDW